MNTDMKKMIKYIADSSSDFWSRLEAGDKNLPDELKRQSGGGEKGPKSLASKICKYFCELFFENTDKEDNYYINDTVVRRVLPYYLHYYQIEVSPEKNTRSYFEEKITYAELYDYLEKIRNHNDVKDEKLTRSQIDHIMWYCYRYENIDDGSDDAND